MDTVEYRSVIKYLFLKEKLPKEIHGKMRPVYVEKNPFN